MTPVDPSVWRGFGLASCLPIEVTVILRQPRIAEDFPNLQPNVRAFQYMLDQISEGPRNIETLTIFVRLKGRSYLEIVSQAYDWDRLVTLVCSTTTSPNLNMVDFILLAEEEDFKDVALECCKVVHTALRRTKRLLPKRRLSLFKVTCEQGDYYELVRARFS